MGTTPNYAWPYPELNSPPDGAAQMKALALAVDGSVKPIDTGVQGNVTAIAGLTARLPVATSTTRPTPVPGALLYETNTGRMMMGVSVASVNYWVPLPGAHVLSVRQTAAQSIVDGAPGTMVNFQAVDDDPFAMWVAGTPTRVTPKFPGWFLFNGGVSFASNQTNYRACQWYKSGGQVLGAISNQTGVSGTGTGLVAKPFPLYLNGTTDYVELNALQTSGAALSTAVSSPYQPTIAVAYMGQ